MDNQSEVIRQQMEDTRLSLQDKLEVLEQQVMNTVQDANQTVETVKETVEAVKDTVKETVDAVKDSVQGTVDSVKDTFQGTVASVKESLNLEHQVKAHPWLMLAGAAVTGYLGGRLLLRLSAPPRASQPVVSSGVGLESPVWRPSEAAAAAPAVHPSSPRKPSYGSSLWNTLTAHYGDEIDKLKSLAVSAAGNVARDLITQSAPPQWADQIKSIVDGVTAKMGGEPMEGSVLNLHSEACGSGHRQESSVLKAPRNEQLEAISATTLPWSGRPAA